MKRTLAAILFLLASQTAAAESPIEKEYAGTILLIDHASGDVGLFTGGQPGASEGKLALKGDPKEIYVSNGAGQTFDFTDVKVGDNVEVYTQIREGRETIVDIVDHNRFEN